MTRTKKMLAITKIAIALTVVTITPTLAQQRVGQSGFMNGDINSILTGVRAIASMSVTVVPFALLAFYTWKMRPKDCYEASWLALGWCGLAYILK
jgi:hypothetical protein